MTSSGVLVLAILALGAVLALQAWKMVRARRVTIYPWEAGLLYREGRFDRVLDAGRHTAGLWGREIHRIPTTRQIATLPAQEVLTADGFPVKLSVIVQYRITDPRLAQESTGGAWAGVLHAAVQLALRAPVQSRGLDAVLADRGALEAEFLPPIQQAAAAHGLTVDSVALRDLVLPAEIRRMVTEVERARREGLAALERARGEQAALRSLANAARLMKGNPELHALRVLQALQAAPGKQAPTLVLGAGTILPVATGGAEPAAPPPESDSAA